MPDEITEQLLQIPRPKLVELALAGLSRQGPLVGQVIDRMPAQASGRLEYIVGQGRPAGIYLVGCGDSYFAGMSARLAYERMTGIPTVCVESLEFARYRLVVPGSLVIVVSSGGEVSTTIEASRAAREAGATVIGITAQKESRLAHEGPCLIASPELSKTDPVDQVALMLGNFSFSLAALYVMAVHLGERLDHLEAKDARAREAEIGAIPAAIEQAMECSRTIEQYLGTVKDEADFYFVGAGPSTGVALFYQAKFFEQAQRPVYGAELEEFTHEQFFLLRPGRDAEVWLIAPRGRSTERAREVTSGCRELGARVVAVTSQGDDLANADLTLPVGLVSEMFSPLISAVPGGLLGIHAFGRWGSGPLSASERHRQMAVGGRLTRGEGKE